ncbi:MAG: hypothetical protein KHX03_04710 [Clostridium sp.]|nr:hypothetical protein [Clostridium sp.]
MKRTEKIRLIKKEMLSHVSKLEKIINRQKKIYNLWEIIEVYKVSKLMQNKMLFIQEMIHKI